MNLRHVSDEKLLTDIKIHMERERTEMTIVLHHLREIEERKLFAALTYPSIYKYAMKELNLTESEANSRVAAARLLRQMPQVEEKIESGALSLTNVLQARSFFNAEKKANNAYTVEEKLEVLEKLENTSTRDGQRLLLSLSSKPELLMESSRVVSPTLTERKFVSDQALDEKLERIKGIWAHALPCATLHELLHKMADVVLEQIDPLKKAERAQARQAKKQATNSRCGVSVSQEKMNQGSKHDGQKANASGHGSRANPVASRADQSIKSTTASCRNVSVSQKSPLQKSASEGVTAESQIRKKEVRQPERSRHRSSTVNYALWLRDGGQCTHIGPDGKRCECRHGLEADHVIPFALGGENTLDNLRLVCRSHNVFYAVKAFGVEKMRRHSMR